MIRIVLADDHHLVRKGIRALLDRVDDIDGVGEAGDGYEAIQQVQDLNPDVLVMDIAMPRLNGTQATERIRSMDVATQVVILSMYSDETLVRQALRCGARGYLLKRSVTEELLLAVERGTDGRQPEIHANPHRTFMLAEKDQLFLLGRSSGKEIAQEGQVTLSE